MDPVSIQDHLVCFRLLAGPVLHKTLFRCYLHALRCRSVQQGRSFIKQPQRSSTRYHNYQSQVGSRALNAASATNRSAVLSLGECCWLSIVLMMVVTTRHHCRACLRSVCNNHSMQRRAVPKRHHPEAVRVCDECILKKVCDDTQLTEPVPALRSTLDAVSSISNSVYTPCKQLATSLVRPSYWEADEAVEFCGQHSQGGCKQRFDNEVLRLDVTQPALSCGLQVLMKHHCRVCGLIFCDGCCGHYHHTPLFTLAQRTCNLCHSEIVCQ